MNIGIFYQSGYKFVACYMALQQLRKFYPNIPIVLYEDGSNILESIAQTFSCDYKKTDLCGSNAPLSGRPVIDINTNLKWLGRIYDSCQTTLKDVEWFIVYEDDVWCRRQIEILPKFDLAGANGPLYTTELQQYLFDKFNANDRTREHWSDNGSLVSYQACGGTIVNREKFMRAYADISTIDWSIIHKLDSRPCEWSDASLSFIMQYAGYSCGRWGDWGNYDTKNKGVHWNKTGWTAPFSQTEIYAFVHGYKHFYNYKEDELNLAKEYAIKNLS